VDLVEKETKTDLFFTLYHYTCRV